MMVMMVMMITNDFFSCHFVSLRSVTIRFVLLLFGVGDFYAAAYRAARAFPFLACIFLIRRFSYRRRRMCSESAYDCCLSTSRR